MGTSSSLRPSYNGSSSSNRSYKSSLISWIKITVLFSIYFWLLLFGIYHSEWNLTTISNIASTGSSTGSSKPQEERLNEKGNNKLVVEDLRGYAKLQKIHGDIIKKEEERIKKRKEEIMKQRRIREKERSRDER